MAPPDYSDLSPGLSPGLFPDAKRNADTKGVKHKSGLTFSVVIWLLVWFVVALAIRLTNLTLKAAWMDEVATTLFSLGNYSRLIPLNEIISLDQLLRPLQFTPGTGVGDVVTHLLAEDNHPPTYFVLAHWWTMLAHRLMDSSVDSSDGYASLWVQRSLPAFFGALAVPATYLLAWFSFRETTDLERSVPGTTAASNTQARTIGLLCAALMAVSPFSVFLSQEARHYSLAILAVIASLCSFVLAVRAVAQRRSPSWTTIFFWIIINTLSLTVHFFCGLALIAEGGTLLIVLIQQWREDRAVWRRASWLRIYVAAIGTLAGALLWLPILANFYGSPQTSFLKSGARSFQYWINPVFQSLASWLYVVLSPVSNGYSWQAITAIVVSCILLLGYTFWLLVNLKRSFQFQRQQPALQTSAAAMGGFFIIANVLFFVICYGLGFDITRGHRYSFVFFPSLIVLAGLCLTPFWQEKFETTTTLISTLSTPNFNQVKLPLPKRYISGRAFVAVVIAVAFFGTQVIVHDYSNLKFYKANRFIDLIQAKSTHPVVVGTYTTITSQPSVIGIEIMSVGWEIQRNFNPDEADSSWDAPPRFVIAENNVDAGKVADAELSKSLSEVQQPLDLWLLDMDESPDLSEQNCTMPADGEGSKGSFRYLHYVCNGESNKA